MADAYINSTINNNHNFKLLYIDINDFKRINDNFGHSIGDEVLIKIALHFKNIAPKDALIARFGGDEFVILFKETSDDSIARKLLFKDDIESILLDINTLNEPLNVAFSIGIFIGLNTTKSIDEILRKADMKMYQNKSKIYKEEMSNS